MSADLEDSLNAEKKKLTYHPVNDFTPITQLTEAGMVLVVNPSLPVKNFKEFLTWARTQKELNFGSAGLGSGGHLAGELFNLQAGTKAQHIPYKGTGPAIVALMGGEYHFNFAGLLGVLPLTKAGKLRALAVTTDKRIPGYEDLPTVKESGLPDFVVVGWYGIMAPARLPKPLVASIHAALIKALNDPVTNKRLVGLGSTPVGNDPETFRKFLLADMAKWQDVVKKSGAKAE